MILLGLVYDRVYDNLLKDYFGRLTILKLLLSYANICEDLIDFGGYVLNVEVPLSRIENHGVVSGIDDFSGLLLWLGCKYFMTCLAKWIMGFFGSFCLVLSLRCLVLNLWEHFFSFLFVPESHTNRPTIKIKSMGLGPDFPIVPTIDSFITHQNHSIAHIGSVYRASLNRKVYNGKYQNTLKSVICIFYRTQTTADRRV